MLRKLLQYIVLPGEISDFEKKYLARMNRIALIYFAVHVPVMMVVAWMCDTGSLLAGGLSLATLVGPLIAYKTFDNPRRVSLVFGVTSMFMGGLLVHFGQGAMQIEMHFYFFVSLALMAVFANPLVIVFSAVTVAAHHATLYFLLPASVFNYEASLWAVAVHALFVVLESVAACFVARVFFDIIGLERIVMSRNRDIRRVFDHSGQGFLSADPKGALSPEHSRTAEAWLGGYEAGCPIWELIGRKNVELGRWMKVAWQGLTDKFLPVDIALDELPKRLELENQILAIEYRAILENGTLQGVLLILSDVTAQVERERLEAEQQENLVIFRSLSRDRTGFQEFMEDARKLVGTALSDAPDVAPTEIRRAVHTLKGNASMMDLHTWVALCHSVEDRLSDGDGLLELKDRDALRNRWMEFGARVKTLMGVQRQDVLEVEKSEHLQLVQALRGTTDREVVARRLESWQHEHANTRLNRMADQARAAANRLGKPGLVVTCVSDPIRFQTENWGEFWSTFSHVLRNAVDHGIEDPHERVAHGKSAEGQLTLECRRLSSSEVEISVRDDGRGMDWDRIRQTAKAANLPCDTQEQLKHALFQDGFTTRTLVNEFSGRGVGMGSVRRACERLNGTMEIESVAGQGSVIRFRFPEASLLSNAENFSLGRIASPEVRPTLAS
jgi:two-component system chemotaxis sensor kinase CheA